MFGKNSTKIRYGVIGLGERTYSGILPNFARANQNSELVALVSRSAEKLQFYKEKYNIPHTFLLKDIKHLLNSSLIDALYIATPSPIAQEIAELAVSHNLHILSDKPISIENPQGKVMIAYRHLFESANHEVRELTRQGQIGEPRLFNTTLSYRSESSDDSLLYNLGGNCINIARRLFNSEPIEVMAMSSGELISFILKFPKNQMATINIGSDTLRTADYEMIGSSGRIRLEEAYEYSRSMTMKVYEGNKITIKKFPRRDLFSRIILAFSHYIQNDKNIKENGIQDTKIIRALELSLDLGTPITLREFGRRKPRSSPSLNFNEPTWMNQ